MTTSTRPWDTAEHLDSIEAIVAYLEAAFEDGDPALVAHALGTIARSRGMTDVARQSGVTREALYRALSENGDPRLSTFLGVIKALGLRISVASAA